MNCNKLDQKGYNYHKTHPNSDFTCFNCLADYIPFSAIDNNQTNEFNINYAPRIRDQNYSLK